MSNPYKIGTRVETPEGIGVIIAESPVGEFMIRLDGAGLCYYYEDDLNLEQGSTEDS